MDKPVSSHDFDPNGVAGTTFGAIDSFRAIDGIPPFGPAPGRVRVPRGAPVAMAGWAVDPGSDRPPRAITLLVDGTRTYGAETGLGRYDVKALLGPATAEHVGFRALLPTDRLPPGQHEVRAFALGADGEWYQAGGFEFSVVGAMRPELPAEGRPVTIRIDSVLDIAADGARGPLQGVVSRGHFAGVHGWAVDIGSKRPPEGVCVVDAAGGRWNSICDIARADVRSSTGAEHERLGFEVVIPVDALPAGKQTLTLWAFGADGRRHGRPAVVDVDVSAPQRLFPAFAHRRSEPAHAAALLRRPPATNALVLRADRTYEIARDELVQLEGWAYASESERPGQILLELHPDGVPIPPYRYHPVSVYARKDAPRELSAPARDDAWFRYVLDPSNLPAGTYRLDASVVDEDGCGYARIALSALRIVDPRTTVPAQRGRESTHVD